MTYVDDVQASLHDENTVYAVMENHKRGDQKPYVLKSTNKGRTWKSIVGNFAGAGFCAHDCRRSRRSQLTILGH